jgi:hypothetical protein
MSVALLPYLGFTRDALLAGGFLPVLGVATCFLLI